MQMPTPTLGEVLLAAVLVVLVALGCTALLVLFSEEKRLMTPTQRTALTRPCLLAFECAHPRYSRLAAGGKVSVIVTVNNGYE